MSKKPLTSNEIYSEERRIFDNYLSENGIRKSAQRYRIMEIFLAAKHHISVAELAELVKRKYPGIGSATVYRTIKLFCDAGLAEEINIGDGVTRYEHKYGHEHHDHLICTKCGNFIETQDLQIEKLQNKLAKRYGFKPHRHRLQIFGTCSGCSK